MASNDAFNTTRSFRIPPPSSSPQPNQPTVVLARRAPTGHYLRQPREETESPDQDLSNYQIHVHPDAGAESAEVRVEALTVYGLNNGTVLPPVSPAHESVNGNWDQFIFGPNGGGCGLEGKEYRPLTRKISVSAAVLVPYRILIFFRMVVLVIYLAWRIRNKNEDAVWLWGMSVTCEIWFTVSWLLEQLPKLSPVKRTAELTVLKDKFETAAGGKSDLPGIDVFIVTADPDREPPLVNANTILSVLAADYPVEKLACYLSDDAGSLLTFETVAETASFAAVWVPFCRKHDIEPRGPENYFSLKDPYRRNKMRPDFVRDKRRVKSVTPRRKPAISSSGFPRE